MSNILRDNTPRSPKKYPKDYPRDIGMYALRDISRGLTLFCRAIYNFATTDSGVLHIHRSGYTYVSDNETDSRNFIPYLNSEKLLERCVAQYLREHQDAICFTQTTLSVMESRVITPSQWFQGPVQYPDVSFLRTLRFCYRDTVDDIFNSLTSISDWSTFHAAISQPRGFEDASKLVLSQSNQFDLCCREIVGFIIELEDYGIVLFYNSKHPFGDHIHGTFGDE